MSAPADTMTTLAECLEEAAGLDGVDAAACRQLAGRFAGGTFNLMVAGEFKRGKSSLINALLGAAVLPVAVVPLTSVVTLIRFGEAPRVIVKFMNGQESEVALDAVAEYATEKGNPNNAKGVELVTIAWPSAWLHGGIRLVDTPGIGSVHRHNTDVTYRYLPQADAVLFVASVDQPVGHAEVEFLRDIRRYADKVFCLLNKADTLSPEELRESAAFAVRTVHAALGAPVPVIPVSARTMLAGRARNDPELLRESGLPELEAALKRLLGEERRAVWLASMAKNLGRILTQARLAVGLERSALDAPIAEIEAKLAAFSGRKETTLRAMDDDDVLFDAATRKLLKERIEPELDSLRLTLQRSVAEDVERRLGELKDMPAQQLLAVLEEHAIDAVRRAYDDWRAGTDAIVAREFNGLCERFWHDIQDTADALSRYAAELFSVPFEAIRGNSPWQPQADFYYKFWSEPGALAQLGDSFVGWLPRFLSEPMIRDRAKRRAVELVEMQAGRVRHNFEERLKKSAHDFRKQMRVGMEATIAAIESAVARGVARRQQGKVESAPRRCELEASTQRIDELEARIGSICGEAAAPATTSTMTQARVQDERK